VKSVVIVALDMLLFPRKGLTARSFTLFVVGVLVAISGAGA
jgi:hypothetical protein